MLRIGVSAGSPVGFPVCLSEISPDKRTLDPLKITSRIAFGIDFGVASRISSRISSRIVSGVATFQPDCQ